MNTANKNTKPILTVYLKSKRHQGNVALAVLLSLNGYRHIQRLQSKLSLESGSIAILITLGYLYKYYRKYDIHLYITRHNLVQIMHILPELKQQHWPVTEKSSNELYQEAQKTQKPLDLSKIPSNYQRFIPIYKRLAKAVPFFKNGLHVEATSSHSPNVQDLTQYLSSIVDDLPPTREFIKARELRKSSSITIKLKPSVKRDFLKICQKQGMNYKDFICSSIASYVNSHSHKK